MKPTTHHRGKTRRELQQVRDRLMSQTGIAPAYDYELLFLFARNQIKTGPAVMMFAVTVSLLLSFWADWTMSIAWLSAILFAQGWMQRNSRILLEETSETVDLEAWTKLFTASEFFCAALWSSLTLAAGTVDSLATEVFIFSALLIVVCVRTIQASPLFSAVYAATFPITLTLACIFIGTSGIELATMIAIAVCAQVFFILIGRRMNETTLTMLQFRAEKDILITQLEEEKVKSDEARRRAEDANIAKSHFLATMSHELRTPLNAILGFSEMMKEEVYGKHSSPHYAEYAGDIHASGKHLLDLINEILDLSRIEAGRYEINEEALRLCDIAEDCCYLMALRAEAKGVEIRQKFTRDMPRVWADGRAFRQVCLNLLSNAVKFTPAGGKISVHCDVSSDGHPFISIRDTGPGIPENELENIMTAFGQGSLAHETAEDGAGLGLAIVRGLVELHGGEFMIQSRVREGTLATVIFPARRIMASLEDAPSLRSAAAA